MEFMHNFDKNKKISFSCGKAGLLIPSNKLNIEYEQNFMNQIHKNLENIDYSFTFKFDNNKNNDGLFIIGIESIEKNNKNELVSIYAKQTKYGEKFLWRFDMDEIIIDNQSYEIKNEDFIIKSQIEGIEVPYSFYNKLNEVFFNNYYQSKICFSEMVNNYYIVISCNSEKFKIEDIKKFPKINFLKYKIGYNFTFVGEELFYQKNNIYIFKIISVLEKYKTNFNLGRMFLKKYQVIFNTDSKSILFYKNNNVKNDIHENNITKKNIALFVISYIIIGIMFLWLGIYFGRKFCLFHRRIYANELEDNNYVYESKKNNVKKEQKLIEL